MTFRLGKDIRLAMLGMIEGNGHPWSWSAILNGYDRETMSACPFPVIPQYLNRQPHGSVGLSGVRVTHLWTDQPGDAPPIARAAGIERIVDRPEAVLGEVDAVIVATDDGEDHVRRVRPFIEAGLPVFVDKPLASNIADLKQFLEWEKAGGVWMSSSGMRYAPEMRELEAAREQTGDWRWLTSVTCKTWERYGIHALEAVYPLVGPGMESVRTEHRPGSDLVHLDHRSGVRLTVAALEDAFGSFGQVHAYGTKGAVSVKMQDTYTAFRDQLLSFVTFLRTGKRPFPNTETVELMAVIIAGRRSRELKGREVSLREIMDELEVEKT